MLTQYEHYAVSTMMGKTDTPPRANGNLCFYSDWERSAFGIALALAKAGYFEWDAFRDELIASIKEWEDTNGIQDTSWNYYDQWLTALERAVLKAGVADTSELAALLKA